MTVTATGLLAIFVTPASLSYWFSLSAVFGSKKILKINGHFWLFLVVPSINSSVLIFYKFASMLKPCIFAEPKLNNDQGGASFTYRIVESVVWNTSQQRTLLNLARTLPLSPRNGVAQARIEQFLQGSKPLQAELFDLADDLGQLLEPPPSAIAPWSSLNWHNR